ncbi:MAG: ATP-binding protein [Lewinella sp.]
MRLGLSVLLVLFFSQLVTANKDLATCELTGPIDSIVTFYELAAFLPDKGELYTIEDILDGTAPDFSSDDAVLKMLNAPFYWQKASFSNVTNRAITGILALPPEHDFTTIYVVVDGRPIAQHLVGSRVSLNEKYLKSSYSLAPFSLDPGVVKTFYWRTDKSSYLEKWEARRGKLLLAPSASFVSDRLNLFFWDGFFLGVLLLFSLVSAFLFSVFREWAFLYFAGLMFSFALYVLSGSFALGSVLNLTLRESIELNFPSIMGIIFFLSLFVCQYLRLRQFHPRLVPVYLLTSCFLMLLQFRPLAFFYIRASVPIGNVALAGWILFTIIVIVLRTVKKDKAARILLLSILALFLGGSILLFVLFWWEVVTNNSNLGFKIGIIAFSSILFYSLFDKYNFLRAEKQRMEKLDELKSRFFANISHEFRTPLTLMLGPIQQVMEKAKDPEDKLLLGIAHRNAGRQLGLVNQLLDLAKAESGKLRLRAKEQDYIPLLKGTVYSFTSLAEQRDLRLEVDCPEAPLPLFFDQEKMEQIIINLVSNACKFTPDGGRVSVALNAFPKKVELVISDTGQGISPERLPFIFDRFFRAVNEATETTEGHGIGLALVKELVELHHGSISLDSKLGEGTTISVVFPRGKAHLEPEDLILTPATAEKTRQKVISEMVQEADAVIPAAEPTVAKDKTHVLIIEDNADVRLFIRQRLDSSYHITEAADGEAGIQQALAELPDLIISDVMMPKKDGYEVCQALKSDVRTSHIPIILLTAKAGREEKLEGLETGADDYLTKPFDAQELELRVANLIRLREQLRQRFAIAISIRPSEIVTNSLDQTFLENALAVVETNIGNEDFNIDAFAGEVGMSRPNLNRKLRALVNQSSNQFIQSIRLQRAADMLRQKVGNVGEIAFQTGFRSTAYFVKCFGDHYGVTPGNFVDNPPEASENKE